MKRSLAPVATSRIRVAGPLLLMAGLYWLSALPGEPLPNDPELYRLFYWVAPVAQNALHVPAYALLAFSWHWALRAWLNTPHARPVIAFAIALSYGLFDEWHQSFVPGRFASLTDVALNTLGATLGIWLAGWFESRTRKAQQDGRKRRE